MQCLDPNASGPKKVKKTHHTSCDLKIIIIYCNKKISQLEINNKIISNPGEILKAQGNFFKELHMEKKIQIQISSMRKLISSQNLIISQKYQSNLETYVILS